MNYGILPLSLREGRLHQVEGLLFGDDLPSPGVLVEALVPANSGKSEEAGPMESAVALNLKG